MSLRHTLWQVKPKPAPTAAPPYDSACVAFNLRRSSQAANRVYLSEMKNAPVRGPLFSLMMILERRGPSTITALAHEIGLDRTTLTRNLQPLERKGLINIEQLNANRKEVSLLPKGSAALAKSAECWRKAQQRVIGQLGEERWKRLREDLAAVIALT